MMKCSLCRVVASEGWQEKRIRLNCDSGYGSPSLDEHACHSMWSDMQRSAHI